MAAVEKVKGVQFNYVNHLWKELAWIEEQKKLGHFAVALQTLIDLLLVVPKDLSEKFKSERERIEKEMAYLRQKVRAEAVDEFSLWILEPKVLNRYAADELPPFLRSFSDSLDAKDYFEKRSPSVPEGTNY